MKKLLMILLAMLMLLSVAAALAETATEAAPEATAEVVETVEGAEAPAEEAAEETEESAYGFLGKTSSIITLAVVLVVMIVLLVLSAKRVKWGASMIAKAAMAIALAYVLSLLKLHKMPMGGSVTLCSMLPLIMFAMAFGPMEGLLAGFAYGLLDLLVDPSVIHPIQLLVDYPMAYGALALCCAACRIRNNKLRLPIAILLAFLGRFIMAVLSGVVFFADDAGEQGALLYSMAYNGSYLGPDALMCIIVSLIPGVSRLPELMSRGTKK